MVAATLVGRQGSADVRDREKGPASPRQATDFAAFYRAEREWLFRYFRRRVGRDAAPDLVHDAFARMLRSGAFERVEHPRAYLARVAHHLSIEHGRQRSREPDAFYSFDESRDAPVEPGQERRLDAIDLRRAFRPVLLAMPRKTRRIFLMHRLCGLTYRDISARMGIGEKAVDKHMGRALKRCRKVAARC